MRESRIYPTDILICSGTLYWRHSGDCHFPLSNSMPAPQVTAELKEHAKVWKRREGDSRKKAGSRKVTRDVEIELQIRSEKFSTKS